MRTKWIYVGVPATLLALSAALAAAPVLHEYFDPSGTTPPSAPAEAAAGGEPADVAEPSRDAPSAVAPSSESDSYTLDSDTSRPDQVGYSDPFTPAIPPFKRSHAFDAVNEQLELIVADPTLQRVPVGGTPAASEDQFYGDIELQLGPGQPLRVPSVGPGARLIAARTEPPTQVQVFADSADNWFLRSNASGPHRLLVHLSIERAVFGSAFSNPTWAALSKHLPTLPPNLERVAAPVLQRVGVSTNQSPASAAARLIQYFREFAPSDDETPARGAALYQSIALGQKGVCRHRAFAFVVSALALGLPSRFVHNEAHAWVEVFDTQRWHRVDLGGAAAEVGLSGNLDVPHVNPQDPYPWPPNSERGQDMVQDALARSTSAPGSGSATGNRAPSASPMQSPALNGAAATSDALNPNASAVPTPDPSSEPGPSPLATSASAAPTSALGADPPPFEATPNPAQSSMPAPTAIGEPAPARISLTVVGDSAVRGARLALSGRIEARDADCSLQRVSVLLADSSGRSYPIGVLVSDSEGHFWGEVTVPTNVPVGDYDLFVSSNGGGTCQAASSRQP